MGDSELSLWFNGKEEEEEDEETEAGGATVQEKEDDTGESRDVVEACG